MIEAERWMGDDTAAASELLIRLGLGQYAPVLDSDGGFLINTLEGLMTASKGDWIIKGIKGEFYPIKNDIFLETYEKVEE